MHSRKDDIELPLLSKNSHQPPQFSTESPPPSSQKQYFNTNLLSRALFSWVDPFIYVLSFIFSLPLPLIQASKGQTFQQEDHHDLRSEEECQNISERFSQEWEKTKNEKSGIIKTQYQAFKSSVWISQLFALIDTCCAFTGPVLISAIITYIQTPNSSLAYGIFLILAFILARIGVILANSQSTQYLTVLQGKMLKGTLSLIYKKSLGFPLMRNNTISAGNIMTYMLVDAENMCKIFTILPQLVQFPLFLTLGIISLYKAAGLTFIAGCVTVFLTGSTISYITKITFGYQKKVMTTKDVRMKKTNEILVGIKYIKMCGTEEKFLESVSKDRNNELYWIRKKNLLAGFRIITFWLSPVLLSLTIFGCYILFYGNLTAEKTFVVLSTIVILQGPIVNIGTAVNDLLQGIVSLTPLEPKNFPEGLRRVEKFMRSSEIDTEYITRLNKVQEKTAIKITNGNFYWADNTRNNAEQSLTSNKDMNNYKRILKNIDMNVPKGSFIAILGDVGSGKSSLFNCLLGEMLYDTENSPSIQLNGTIAYMSQKPWILNATIEENIIFDKEYDEVKYKEALRTSCLQADLKSLIKKDKTEIGEKGVNLSGGQKARVALARAIYADCDTYLMDDPLSAVDAHVAKYILEECLCKKLKDKTRVLITHKLESLRYVDYIYILKSGEVIAQGDYDTIKKDLYYQEIEEKANKEPKKDEEENNEEVEAEEELEESPKKSIQKESKKSERKQTQRKETSFHEAEEQKQMMEKLMLNEDRQTGAVTWAIWKSFFSYFGSPLYLFMMIFGISLWVGLRTVADFWLAHWGSIPMAESEHGNGYYYGIYIVLTLTSVTLLFIRMGMSVIGGLNISKRLHLDMFVRVIRAPINLFFDRVPLGRLINRFASDLDVVDNTMPFTLSKIAFIPIDILVKVSVCCYTGTILVIPLAFCFVYIGFKIQQSYFRVYREVFRLSRITLSPITSMVAESLDGLTHIRSLQCQGNFMNKFSVRQNEHMKNLILLAGLWGWFSFRVNLASLLVIAPTITAAIIYSRNMEGSAGLMGLLIIYLLDMSGLMTGFLNHYSTFESNLISFERCRAFTKVEVEKDPDTKEPVTNYSSSWPRNGEIELKNYYAKYRPNLPYVLKDVSFKISGGEKVGVVGRTGSGKSTTLLAILRIIESQKGSIYIDGVDISDIGLDDLRKKITIIPQDPLLYKGSLRSNLDLLEQYNDDQIWTALEKVCMKEKFLQFGLDSEVKEGGENLSAGEKQLICIARAILNKNKIILVDEATSSIDNVTEETILESIRENFKGCTMITIAHRLKTIIESDKILFMEDGRVVEFDAPKKLLSNREGHFYKLWKEYEAAKA